jgi:hypothetical protein
LGTEKNVHNGVECYVDWDFGVEMGINVPNKLGKILNFRNNMY